MKRPTPEQIDREIATLEGLEIKALQNRWRELFKIDPPIKIRSGFLRRAIAYRLQELVHGGLTTMARRQLEKYAEQARARRVGPGDKAAGAPTVGPGRGPIAFSTGTRLMREWNGVTQVVEVVPEGFTWRGTTYRTLSAVAGAITGTKWSGPKFFGLDDVSKSTKARSSVMTPTASGDDTFRSHDLAGQP